MADVSTVDPADQDPISQTFLAANALNVKHFVDQQFQYSNMLLQNAVAHQSQLNAFQSQLNTYSLQSMARTEAINNAIVTRSAKSLLDELPDTIGDSILSQQGAKIAETTPPDTGSLTTLVGQLASLISGLTAVMSQVKPTTGTGTVA